MSNDIQEHTDDVDLDVPREPRSSSLSLDDAIDRKLSPLRLLLQRIDGRIQEWDESHLRAPSVDSDANRPPADPQPEFDWSQCREVVAEHVAEEIRALCRAVEGMEDRVSRRLEALQLAAEKEAEDRAASAEAAKAAPADDPPPWQQVVLGSQFCNDARLESVRIQLVDDLLAGKSDAQSLAGRLLVVRSTPAEQLPPLLKEVGEAFYRWRPRQGDDPDDVEKALVEWLKSQITTGNSIELVHRGDRFDSTRHIAPERGVEVIDVRGWTILREDGKVYTKAPVLVK